MPQAKRLQQPGSEHVNQQTCELTPVALPQVTFDRSGRILACGSDDGTVKVYDVQTKALVADLKGHEDAVQTVQFDPSDKHLISGSSDCTFRIWSL
jgi:sperm-associated antigen 16 protein